MCLNPMCAYVFVAVNGFYQCIVKILEAVRSMTSLVSCSIKIVKEIILFKFVCLTGPLLYHFADMPNELSIELCYEDIHRIAEKIGFQFLVRTVNNEHVIVVVM